MSMSLPINVVIAATAEASFSSVRKVEGLSRPGITPRYSLGALERPTSMNVESFDQIDLNRIQSSCRLEL